MGNIGRIFPNEATIDESIKIADSIIKQLGNFGPRPSTYGAVCGIYGLKALDIPSVLNRNGFLFPILLRKKD